MVREPSTDRERGIDLERGFEPAPDAEPDLRCDAALRVETADEGDGLRSIVLTPESIAAFDAVVVVTDHAEFDWDLVARHARLVIDTRNALANRMRGRSAYVTA
jgi:UDP-N-acetyl-D-mannosaminuronate dehydrogenase